MATAAQTLAAFTAGLEFDAARAGRRARAGVHPRHRRGGRVRIGAAVEPRVMVRLKDGRSFAREAERFRGMPGDVLPRAELQAKFMRLTATLGEARARALWSRLANVEREKRVMGDG